MIPNKSSFLIDKRSNGNRNHVFCFAWKKLPGSLEIDNIADTSIYIFSVMWNVMCEFMFKEVLVPVDSSPLTRLSRRSASL